MMGEKSSGGGWSRVWKRGSRKGGAASSQGSPAVGRNAAESPWRPEVPEEDPALHLKKYGYKLKDDQRIVTLDESAGYTFQGQKEYDAIGQIMEEALYYRMQTYYHLIRRVISSKSKSKRAKNKDGPRQDAFYFCSRETESNRNKMLVLINGSGAVKAGMWSRRLMINESLEAGTQLPYIEWALDNNYRVLVMNTNCNPKHVKESQDPETHAKTVWRECVARSGCQHIAIVAHSYGATVTQFLTREFLEDFRSRVFTVVFTDGVLWSAKRDAAAAHLAAISHNYVCSTEACGSLLNERESGQRVWSAGTTVHEETSWKAKEKVTGTIQREFNSWMSQKQRHRPSQTSSGGSRPPSQPHASSHSSRPVTQKSMPI